MVCACCVYERERGGRESPCGFDVALSLDEHVVVCPGCDGVS